MDSARNTKWTITARQPMCIRSKFSLLSIAHIYFCSISLPAFGSRTLFFRLRNDLYYGGWGVKLYSLTYQPVATLSTHMGIYPSK